MAFGRRPVASLGKRSVYKTEFDIFKQNTDIELISLVSFDENDSCHLENRSSYWSSKASSAGHKTQNDFTSQRKNFEQLNRNSVKIAYDPNYKCSKAFERHNREFKPNIWNKGDTSIYKAFARTSKSFLKNRTYGRKVERSRSCYSANEVRKPTNEELKLTRCQSTCERRTNEPNWITNSQSNKQKSANVENKENTINRSINRQNASTNKALWRTKSAPVTTAQNKPLYTRKQEILGYTARGKSAKPSSRIEKGQAEEKPNVGRTGALNEKRDFINSQKTRSQESPKELSINRIELERDVNTRTNKVIEECTGSNYSCKNLDSEVNTEKQSSDISVKSEVDSVCKSDNNVNTINENTSRDLEITADETPGSKDSGFASNTVSPELDIRPAEVDGGTEQTEPSKKQVKFACEDIEDGASSVDICSVVTECALSDNESIANESDLNALDKHDISTYDITTLLNDLERFGANSRLSVISAGCHSIYSHEGGNDSLCGVEACKHLNELKAPEEESKVEEPDQELIDSAISDLESTNMSKEARHAILETLQDMGVKKDRRGKDLGGLNDLKHRSVNLQRKQKDNRHKYEYFMRERTKSFYKQQFKSMDSVGNDDTSSRHSSSNTREGDDSTSDELKGKLFPTITEMSKSGFRTNRSKQPKQIVTLENVRHKKHKIPGIGNYHMIASPDSDFEITPPGFDIRYNRPIISTEEMEIPPRFIRERSIQKCKNWLKRNISLSPLSLQPAANNKQLSRD